MSPNVHCAMHHSPGTTPPSPPRPMRCNLGVYPLARRTGTQAHRSLFLQQAHSCSSYSARTLSNKHGYMQVIRETDRHLDV